MGETGLSQANSWMVVPSATMTMREWNSFRPTYSAAAPMVAAS
jgi:hypothetical protein